MKTKLYLGSILTALVSTGLVSSHPTAASTVAAEYAIVYAPPSNVRTQPNGKIICEIKQKTTISVYHFTINVNGGGSPNNDWYLTSACGIDSKGWIHLSQIKLTGKYHTPP